MSPGKKPKYRKHTTRDKGFVAWNKRRIYFPGPYNSEESKAAYARFIGENVFVPLQRPTESGLAVSQLAALYLTFAKTNYGTGRTEYGNLRASLKPFIKACGRSSASEFGPRRLKEYRQGLVAQRKSRGYINSSINRIKRCFQWGVSEELIPPSVFHGLQSVRALEAGRTEARETAKRQPVPWEHVEPVLSELSPVVAAMVRFQWHTGARSQSVCMATAEQFVIDGDLWLWRPRHKTERLGKVVVLPIGPKCQIVLKPFMGGDGFLFDPRKRRKNRRYKARYKSGSYAVAVRRAIERVNRQRAKDKLPPLPHWSPHQLRHSKGHAVRSLYGLEAAQAILGHSTVDASQIYSEPRLDLAKRIAREVG